MTGRAPSGPRLLGDDVQHLVVWYHVLRALNPDENIIKVAVEAEGVGNVDDLVVHRSSGPVEYWQVKASIDATSPAGSDWLLGHPKGKTSLLKSLHQSWLNLHGGPATPEVVLATTKNIDSADPVLRMKDRNGRVADALRTGDGDLATARKEWAGHLGVGEDELIAFLEHVEFRTGTDEHGWREKVRDVAGGACVRTDEASIALGVQTVRDWVKDPRKEFTPADLSRIVNDLGLRLPKRVGLLVIEALDACPRAVDATVSLDWMGYFEGDDARVRRRLRDPGLSDLLLQQLVGAREAFRSRGISSVEVDGHMRLPVWFAVGTQLGETAGFTLSKSCRTGIWTTADQPDGDNRGIMLEPPRPLGGGFGAPWVVTVSVSQDIADDAEAFAVGHLPDASFVHLRPTQEPSRSALAGGSDAVRFCVQVRAALRALRVAQNPPLIHLFLAMPGACALFLGHFWDRMPDTIVYWDLGAPGSYEAAFLLRN